MRRGQVSDEWRDRLSSAGLEHLDRLLADSLPALDGAGWTPLVKPGLHGRERWRLPAAGTRPTLYLKRYRRPPLREQLDRLLRQSVRHSRAWWEYQVAQQLARAGIRTARPVAYVEDVWLSYERGSAVLLEGVAGEALDRLWPQLVAGGSPVTRGLGRHELCRRLARFVAAFHGTGLCHRDLYLCHLFVDLDPQATSPPRFALIDLARAHRPHLRLRWVIKDLAQLDASARQIGATRTDRLRFLLTYLGLDACTPRARFYGRWILSRSDRILGRIRRQARRS